jgi:hypothetical protein
MASTTELHGSHSFGDPHHRSQPTELPSVELEIVRGRARNKLRPVLGRAYLIGSADDSDLVLGDPQFPAAFAYLMRDAAGVTLRWLGDGPELSVGGHAIHAASALNDQDRIRTGPFEFRVHIRRPAERPVDGDQGAESPAAESAPASRGSGPLSRFLPRGTSASAESSEADATDVDATSESVPAAVPTLRLLAESLAFSRPPRRRLAGDPARSHLRLFTGQDVAVLPPAITVAVEGRAGEVFASQFIVA